MQKIVAVIDDEEDICKLVSINLEKNGYIVNTYNDGISFFKDIKKNIPNVAIVDIMLPDIDGYDICKKIKSTKEFSNISIIMLSAKSEETDKIIGLELGADDYVTKPFSPKELVARVKAVLRRNNLPLEETTNKIVINKEKFNIIVNGKKIDVTNTEFKILELLMSKEGVVFSRDEILDYVWQDKDVFDRTIDVHIRNLRKKLGKYGNCIKNIHSIGYKFEEN